MGKNQVSCFLTHGIIYANAKKFCRADMPGGGYLSTDRVFQCEQVVRPTAYYWRSVLMRIFVNPVIYVPSFVSMSRWQIALFIVYF